ncbi:hypothetical protein L1049_009062 [Liquidambar formosana]|uniref:SAWADEE domain-containing protein n=1 Tax=Liquidambar formosana TaxID=63359 RepID=A0AAP0S4K4_LIQFO
MASAIAEDAVELEAMRKEDSSWHPCQVSLSSTGVGLVVDFGSQDLEDMILNNEEALTRIRIRSVPLQGDDCSRIDEGEHVLATDKSQFKSLFFDAEVEKALRVRHSKRVHCRCTFMINWLHEDFKGGTSTVPSSSIMKLSTKNINIHPTVAAFLKSIKSFSFSGASPLPTILDDMDCEMDLNRLVEQQIEGIGKLVDDAFNKEISKDTLLGTKVDTNKQMQRKTVAASKVSISHVEVPCDQNHLKRSTRNSRKLQEQMEVKDPPSPALSIQEELSEIRSHLSPLAGRAALASLVSKLPQKLEFSTNHAEKDFTSATDKTTHNHISMKSLNETISFTSCVENNISLNDELSSDLGSASVLAVSESVEIVKPLISTGGHASRSTGLGEASAGIPTKVRKNENKTSEIANSSISLTCSVTERKLSQPINPTRITRSAVQKGTGVPNDDDQMKTSAEDKKLRISTTMKRLTRSAIEKGKENITVEDKQGLKENKSAQTTESDSSEGTGVPNDDVQMKASAEDKKLITPTTMKRLTRSAVEKEKGNITVHDKKGLEENKSPQTTESDSPEGTGVPNDDVEMKTSTEDKKLRTSTTMKRLTRSAVEKEKEIITVDDKQGLKENKSAQTTELDSSEGNVAVLKRNVSEKKSSVSKKKKPVSSPLDAEIDGPVNGNLQKADVQCC